MKLKDEYNLLLIGIRDRTGNLQFNPSDTQQLKEHDSLLLLGSNRDIQRFRLSWQIA